MDVVRWLNVKSTLSVQKLGYIWFITENFLLQFLRHYRQVSSAIGMKYLVLKLLLLLNKYQGLVIAKLYQMLFYIIDVYKENVI